MKGTKVDLNRKIQNWNRSTQIKYLTQLLIKSNELLKYSTSKELLEISNLINLSILKPIIKNEKKARDDPNNTRPFAFSDALAYLYERVLLNLVNKNHN